MKPNLLKTAAVCVLCLVNVYATAQDIQPITSLKSYWSTKDFKQFGEQLTAETLDSKSDGAKIVIYRTQANTGGATNSSDSSLLSFFLNGDYQASLMPGGYTVQSICVGVNSVSVAVNDADRTKPMTVAKLNAQDKQVYFFESILSSGGQVLLFPRQVSELKDVGLLQMHTIPRYTNKPCQSPPAEKVVLGGDGFFAFDKSGINDLQEEGRVKLATFVKYMKTEFERIDSITIDGYTDRFGSVAYNERLSLARANTVKEYFLQHGINPSIVTKGWGPANPIVDCPGDHGKAVTDCLYPNRRIEVSIKGLKKSEKP